MKKCYESNLVEEIMEHGRGNRKSGKCERCRQRPPNACYRIGEPVGRNRMSAFELLILTLIILRDHREKGKWLRQAGTKTRKKLKSFRPKLRLDTQTGNYLNEYHRRHQRYYYHHHHQRYYYYHHYATSKIYIFLSPEIWTKISRKPT